MDQVEIALACDERYFPGLLATIASILVSSSVEYSYRFHVLDGGIKPDSTRFLRDTLSKFKQDIELEMIEVDTSAFDGFPDFFFDSKMAYARLLLPELLNISRVIYVDTDILVFKNMSKLWSNNTTKHAGVCVETGVGVLKNDCPNYKEIGLDGVKPYFNSGLMDINLDKFREDDITEKTFNYLNEYREYCEFWDQTALNVTLYDKLLWLDQSWNMQSHKEAFDPIEDFDLLKNFEINYHFVTSSKPWLKYSNSPPNQLFYTLLKELNFKLTDPDFTSSKNEYEKKMKGVKYLPMIYKLRSKAKRLVGHDEAESDWETAQFWQEQLPVFRFWDKKKESIDQIIRKWRAKINDAVKN